MNSNIKKSLEYGSKILISLVSSILWEFGLKPIISRYIDNPVLINGSIFAIVVFIFTIYITQIPRDPKHILDKGEIETIKDLLNDRRRLEHERISCDPNSPQWKQYSEKLRTIDGRVTFFEGRIENRNKKETT